MQENKQCGRTPDQEALITATHAYKPNGIFPSNFNNTIILCNENNMFYVPGTITRTKLTTSNNTLLSAILLQSWESQKSARPRVP